MLQGGTPLKNDNKQAAQSMLQNLVSKRLEREQQNETNTYILRDFQRVKTRTELMQQLALIQANMKDAPEEIMPLWKQQLKEVCAALTTSSTSQS